MKSDPASPYAPYCDFTINMTDCEGAAVYFIFYAVGAGIHALFVTFGIFSLVYCYIKRRANNTLNEQTTTHQNQKHKFIQSPLDVSTVFAILFLLARLPIIRYVLSIILVFSFGVIEIVYRTLEWTPNRHTKRMSKIPIQVPRRKLVIGFFSTIGVIMTLILPIFGYMAGVRGEDSNWHDYLNYTQIAWCTWGKLESSLGASNNSKTAPIQEQKPAAAVGIASSHVDCNSYATSTAAKMVEKQRYIFNVRSVMMAVQSSNRLLSNPFTSAKRNIKTVMSIADEETKERITAIIQLRRTAQHIIFSFFISTFTALSWGNAMPWIIMNPVASKMFALAVLTILWPIVGGKIICTERRRDSIRIEVA
ncbi:hypothetical protein BDF19DRAFT_432813 [Syncephalis fuscata]|nr:hypothetical protein BDF19DRAFT_432813 [Syncephalis fuscata]